MFTLEIQLSYCEGAQTSLCEKTTQKGANAGILGDSLAEFQVTN